MIAIYGLAATLLLFSAVFFSAAYALGANAWPLRRQTWLRLGQSLIALSLLGGIAGGLSPRRWAPTIAFLPMEPIERARSYMDLDGQGLTRQTEHSIKPSAAAPAQAKTASRPITWLTYFLALGFVAGLARLLWHGWSLHRLIASSLTIRRRGRVSVHVSAETTIPFSALLFSRAHVVLPHSVLEHRHDLRAAMHHEIQHHRNRDTAWILAMETLKILFFWNPAIYLWARQMAQLVELACDEAVVTRKPLGSHDYGFCLLRVAQATLDRRSPVLLGTAGMSTRACGKSFLMRRIEMLTKYRKAESRPAVVVALGVGLGLMLGVVAYAGAAVIGGNKSPQRLPAVNATIQRIAEQALQNGVRQSRADAAFAIVADPRTGEVLAIAYAGENSGREAAIARYLAQPMEPWSLVKPVVTALAIDAGKTTLDEKLDGGHGKIDVGSKEYSDHDVFDTITTAEMLKQSSNVGAIRVALKLGAEPLARGFETFGFGAPSSFPLAGPGNLPSATEVAVPEFPANSAFGLGLRFTPLELVQAYGALANGGTLLKPQEYRAGEITPVAVRRVVSEKTSIAMRDVLAQAVADGTGKHAQLTGVRAAGKTATGRWTRVFDGKEHPKTEVASFIGFAPAEDPQVLVYVNVENPHRGDTQGGRHAAPIFREIAQAALAAAKQ